MAASLQTALGDACAAPRTPEGAEGAEGAERAERAERGRGDARLRQAAIDHFTGVWRFLRRLGVPRDLIDDAVQEVFLVAASKFAVVRPGAEKSYLFGIAVHIAREIRRRFGREHLVDDPDDTTSEPATLETPETSFDLKEEQALLSQLLDTLPDHLRTIFVLFEIEGLSISEIATLLGVPLGTVASRLARARDRFETQRQRLQLQMGGRT
jgi:RNA polymerase sigma-70 factor (ECF subfamily)